MFKFGAEISPDDDMGTVGEIITKSGTLVVLVLTAVFLVELWVEITWVVVGGSDIPISGLPPMLVHVVISNGDVAMVIVDNDLCIAMEADGDIALAMVIVCGSISVVVCGMGVDIVLSAVGTSLFDM